MQRTLNSIATQTERPSLWVIVNDGSTDATPQILSDFAARHDWVQVINKPDRGHRAVGPGVIEAFYVGLEIVDLENYTYLCKLDLDLDLPDGYFAGLMDRMQANPRVGTCSGKTYYTSAKSQRIPENFGDEMSIGPSKFYSVACFHQIGGFVREVMWDGIDCHKARMLGWTPVSWDDPDLQIEHLRPMGSSQKSVYTGRRRHGFGQYYMGSDPFYFVATAIKKMVHPPYLFGGLATLQGYFGAMACGVAQQEDADLRTFIRDYQRRALRMGKKRAIAQIEEERADLWNPSARG